MQYWGDFSYFYFFSNGAARAALADSAFVGESRHRFLAGYGAGRRGGGSGYHAPQAGAAQAEPFCTGPRLRYRRGGHDGGRACAACLYAGAYGFFGCRHGFTWRLQNDNDKFKMHKFALACVLDEIEAGATDLVFYLRHDKGADDKTDVYYSNWYGYDIKNALERFKEKAGNLPTKLVIKSHESGNNSNTEIPENYTEYTVEYKIASTNQ